MAIDDQQISANNVKKSKLSETFSELLTNTSKQILQEFKSMGLKDKKILYAVLGEM